MTQVASRRSGLVAGLFVVTLLAAGCGGTDAGGAPGTASSTPESTSPAGPGEKKVAGAERPTEAAPSSLTVVGVDDVEVTLAGPIATKYASATAAQKDDLGQPLTGDHNAGTRDSGVVFQQFQGGVVIAKSADPGTPAYIITSGRIRDAWNTERDPDGIPLITGKNGSAGPLGVPTSDLTTDGDRRVVTFDHGTISESTTSGDVTVTVNGKTVPSGLE